MHHMLHIIIVPKGTDVKQPLVRKKDILRLAEKHNDVEFCNDTSTIGGNGTESLVLKILLILKMILHESSRAFIDHIA